jgi:hypothetical protein
VDQIRTTGVNSISELLGSMEAIRTEAGGSLAGIPLRLRMSPRSRKDSPGTIAYYVLSVEAKAETGEELLEQADHARIHRERILTLRAAKNITEPTLEDRLRSVRTIGFEESAEAMAIQQEFYPNQAEVAAGQKETVVAVLQAGTPEPSLLEAFEIADLEALLGLDGKDDPNAPSAKVRLANSFQRVRLERLRCDRAQDPALTYVEAESIAFELERKLRRK